MDFDPSYTAQQFKSVGTRPLRPDGVDKVTGRARYGADFNMPGQLVGRVLRSPHAHAIIRKIDTSKAEALKGVKAVVTAADLPDLTDGNDELHAILSNCMAREKALAVEAGPDDLVLCADNTVALGRRILGKPEDEADAVRMLLLMSGRRHRVITAVALRRGDRLWSREVEAVVQMKRLSDSNISWYIRTGEWRGKAGAYGIQGAAGAFIPSINGSFTAIVGLPLAETANLLTGAGYRWDMA